MKNFKLLSLMLLSSMLFMSCASNDLSGKNESIMGEDLNRLHNYKFKRFEMR